jgi:hypothetical protein
MAAGTISRPWRRSLRISVRGLIVVVLVCGVWLGWLVRGARIQREAVAAITRAGGSAKYDWGWTDGNYLPGEKFSKPGWLVKRIGVDYCGRVTQVWLFSSSTEADATLVHVGRLSQLQRLDLYRAPFSDAGLANLKGMTKLSYLDLGDSHVSDTGLANLKGMIRLSHLDLSGTQVTDAGLAHLTGLTNLSTLGLGHTQVSDAGVVHLKRLTNLSALGLFATRVTDAGVEELKRTCPKLTISR